MPDSIVLYSAQGSPYPLTSALLKDPGPDYGRVDLPRAQITESAAMDGGVFTYDRAGVRRMSFPLRLASGMYAVATPYGDPAAIAGASLAGTLDEVDSLLSEAAREGAYIDIQPANVASSQAVRFDVLNGQISMPKWSIDQQRISRREVNLELDVKPYGYWPTWIALPVVEADAAWSPYVSPSYLGTGLMNLMGDAPMQLRILIQPTAGSTTNSPPGVWVPDMIAWSMAAPQLYPRQDSMMSFFGPSAYANGTYAAAGGGNGATAFAATTLFIFMATTAHGASFQKLARFPLEAGNIWYGMHGRYRLFLAAYWGPSMGGGPYQLSADVVDWFDTDFALASAAPVATVAPAVASGSPGAYGAQPSPCFQVLDMGEISLPANPAASGNQSLNSYIRIFGKSPTTNVGIATASLRINGFYLHPIEGPNGILRGGLTTPTLLSVVARRRLELDADAGYAHLTIQTNLAGMRPDTAVPAYPFYSGNLPVAYPERAAQYGPIFTVMTADRKSAVAATGPLVRATSAQVGFRVWYRPRFKFMKGI